MCYHLYVKPRPLTFNFRTKRMEGGGVARLTQKNNWQIFRHILILPAISVVSLLKYNRLTQFCLRGMPEKEKDKSKECE